MTLALVYALGLLLLPAPPLPNREGQTHARNGPAWSPTQEHLANIAYAFIGPRIGRRGLVALVTASRLALAALGASHDSLQMGWDWPNLWAAPVRTAFPFYAGVLLQRSGLRLNGLFEAALVIGLFPFVIAAGAAAEAQVALGKLCRLCGQLSYPIYIIHWPIVGLFSVGSGPGGRRAPRRWPSARPVVLALPLLAWAALKLYDEPVRACIAGRRQVPQQTLAGVGEGARLAAGRARR